MIRALPRQRVCFHLLDLYRWHFENTYRIVHVPTFYHHHDELCKMWEQGDKEGTLSQFAESIPQLTAVIAIADTCKRDLNAKLSDTARERTGSVGLFRLVDKWLASPTTKRQCFLARLRVRMLMRLAHLTRIDRTKVPHTVWAGTGSLIRLAMSHKLHHDPSELRGVTLFRRLWATVREMDLQASIIRGRTPFAHTSDMTCQNPANFNNDDLSDPKGCWSIPRHDQSKNGLE